MDRFVAWVERVAGIFLLAIALLTFLTVGLRYLFSIQIPDWFDFSRQLLAIAIFWGIASTTYRLSHITVDIVWEHTGSAWQRRIDLFATAVAVVCLAAFAWKIMDKVFDVMDSGQVTNDLRLPLWPFTLTAALGIVAAFVLACLRFFRLWRGAHGGEAPLRPGEG